MNEEFLQRQTEKVGQIKGEFKRRRASAVFNRADRLSAYSEHINKVALPYFLFSANLR